MGAKISIGPSLKIPIGLVRQCSNPTLEQTNKQVSAQYGKFLFYFLWIYLSGEDSSRARAKSLILHTSVLCTPFSHMNVNGNGSQDKYWLGPRPHYVLPPFSCNIASTAEKNAVAFPLSSSFLGEKDSSRAWAAKSLILHTFVLCTPFSHMNVNGNWSQDKY